MNNKKIALIMALLAITAATPYAFAEAAQGCGSRCSASTCRSNSGFNLYYCNGFWYQCPQQ